MDTIAECVGRITWWEVERLERYGRLTDMANKHWRDETAEAGKETGRGKATDSS